MGAEYAAGAGAEGYDITCSSFFSPNQFMGFSTLRSTIIY
jgi:hypothetical protein